jgi:hypothetical protein
MALVASPTVNLEELDRLGFTVVRGLLPRTLTGALRQCTYQLGHLNRACHAIIITVFSVSVSSLPAVIVSVDHP